MFSENNKPNSTNTPHNEQSYVVLARRTRPQSFSELIGQEDVAQAIEGMLNNNKIPHAFLFTGTRGTGKTSSARILAKSLCCEAGPTAKPCQTCVHCKQITACAHEDILEIDGASNTGIENIRELREATRFYPNSARFKVFIIDEVHMLSTGAFNALLKTLEEPPPQVVFILATTELHKVPITVRSRCMIFSFKKIETNVIAEHLKNILLKENISFDNNALTLIAREAKGSLRDSLSLLEQTIAFCKHSHISFEQTRQGLCLQGEEIAEKLFQAICTKDIGQALELLQQADLASLDLSYLIESTAQQFRNAVLVKSLNNTERTARLTQLLPQELELLQSCAKNMSQAALSEIFRLLASSVKDIAKTNAGLAWCEIIITDCISRAEWLSANEVMALLTSHQTQQQPIQPTKEQPLQQNSKVDIDAFKRLVATAEKKSKTLATRLGCAKIDVFHEKLVQFSECPDNASYLDFGASDLVLFWECVKEIKFDSAEFKGLYTPKKPQMTKAAFATQAQKKPVNKPSSNTTPVRRQEEIAQRFQQYSSQSENFTKSTGRQIHPSQSVSLSEIKHQEKNKELMLREKNILDKEHVKQLKNLATEIQIISMD